MNTAEIVAAACHEANRAYCIGIGDNSQVPWDEAPEWQRKSALIGVARVWAGDTPEQLHESWLAEKKRDGWTYGPVKDVERKLHPCMCGYAELPEEQRRKDAIFHSTAKTISRLIGYDV